jgi:hypothetical protein
VDIGRRSPTPWRAPPALGDLPERNCVGPDGMPDRWADEADSQGPRSSARPKARPSSTAGRTSSSLAAFRHDPAPTADGPAPSCSEKITSNSQSARPSRGDGAPVGGQALQKNRTLSYCTTRRPSDRVAHPLPQLWQVMAWRSRGRMVASTVGSAKDAGDVAVNMTTASIGRRPNPTGRDRPESRPFSGIASAEAAPPGRTPARF